MVGPSNHDTSTQISSIIHKHFACLYSALATKAGDLPAHIRLSHAITQEWQSLYRAPHSRHQTALCTAAMSLTITCQSMSTHRRQDGSLCFLPLGMRIEFLKPRCCPDNRAVASMVRLRLKRTGSSHDAVLIDNNLSEICPTAPLKKKGL